MESGFEPAPTQPPSDVGVRLWAQARIFLSTLWRAPRELPTALAHAGPYMVIGIAIGWFGLYLAAALKVRKYSTASEITHHIAVGFFVSSVAVLLYEWGSHFKELLHQTKTFAETMKHYVRRILDASSTDAVKMGVHDLLDRRNERLADEAALLLDAVIALYERGGWCRGAYLTFITAMLVNLRHNAESLAKLSKEIARDTQADADFRLRLPDTGRLADVVLSQVMDDLDSGGRYLAASDIASWAQIPNFVVAQKRAVEKGVRIQRIFVVPDPPPWDAAAVLRHHLRYTTEWSSKRSGAYEVRVMRPSTFNRSKLSDMKHFGAFIPGHSRDPAVMFEVTSTDLSAFRLRGVEVEFLDEFENLWWEEAERTPEQYAAMLLSLQMECPEVTKYHAVSDFNSWRGDTLKSFRDTTRAAFDRGVSVRRVFVYRKEEHEKETCRDIFRDHWTEAADVAKRQSGAYDIKLCTLDEVLDALGANWHFGVFRSSEHAALKVMLSELPSNDFADFSIRAVDSQRRANEMDHFFDRLPPGRQRALELLDLPLP